MQNFFLTAVDFPMLAVPSPEKQHLNHHSDPRVVTAYFSRSWLWPKPNTEFLLTRHLNAISCILLILSDIDSATILKADADADAFTPTAKLIASAMSTVVRSKHGSSHGMVRFHVIAIHFIGSRRGRKSSRYPSLLSYLLPSSVRRPQLSGLYFVRSKG